MAVGLVIGGLLTGAACDQSHVIARDRPTLTPARAAAHVPASCPDRSPWNDGDDTAQPVSPRAGSGRELVPGAPVSALVCVYAGLPQPGATTAGFGIVGQRRLTGEGVSALTQAFNALPRVPSGVSSNCPSDEGQSAAVYFRYGSGPDAQISVSMEGCQDSSNGHFAVSGHPPLLDEVHASTASIHAHEARVSGRVCSNGTGCAVPSVSHLSVKVRSSGLWTAQMAVINGHFSGWVLPGNESLTVERNWLAVDPRTLAKTTVHLRADARSDVTLRIP